jgi:hypothetical protein
MRRASLLFNALAGLVVLAIVFGARPPQSPMFDLVAATGALEVSNSKAGQALFHGDELRPGEQAVGSLTLTNTGGVRASLAVDAVAEQSAAGTGGGRLWDALRLVITDVTTPSEPFSVYEGRLADMGRLTFGGLAPGRKRSFQFAVSLPRTSDDNAYQGAHLSLGFSWSAQAVDTPVPGNDPPAPTPTPQSPTSTTPTSVPTAVPQATPAPVTPTATPTPTASVRAEDVVALPSAKSCVSRRKFAIRVRAANGVVVKTTTVYVNGRKAGTGRGSRAVISLRGLPRGKVKVKVVAVLSDGRRLTLSRTYRTCTTRGH